jgi:hypothetical protein
MVLVLVTFSRVLLSAGPCGEGVELAPTCDGFASGWQGCCSDHNQARWCANPEANGPLCGLECSALGTSCGQVGLGLSACGSWLAVVPCELQSTECTPVCLPGMQCGTDGCGRWCGPGCGQGQVCTTERTCCTPRCDGRACGDDGCGGSCGACPPGAICRQGACAGDECATEGNGHSCDGGDPCHAGDKCYAGKCQDGLTPASCDDGDPATLDDCDPAVGCFHPPAGDRCENAIAVVPEGVQLLGGDSRSLRDDYAPACGDPRTGFPDAVYAFTLDAPAVVTLRVGDGVAAALLDACPEGADAPLACEPDAVRRWHVGGRVLVPGTYYVIIEGPRWFDGPWPQAELWFEGLCTVAHCDDGDPCTSDACEPENGACHAEPVPDGGSCDDGDPCTLSTTCEAGLCTHGAQDSCLDYSDWTDDTCEPGVGCRHRPLNDRCDAARELPYVWGTSVSLDLSMSDDGVQLSCGAPSAPDACFWFELDEPRRVWFYDHSPAGSLAFGLFAEGSDGQPGPALGCVHEPDPALTLPPGRYFLVVDDGAAEAGRSDFQISSSSLCGSTYCSSAPCDESHCDPATGQCVTKPLSEGSACTAACSWTDDGTCHAGECEDPTPDDYGSPGSVDEYVELSGIGCGHRYVNDTCQGAYEIEPVGDHEWDGSLDDATDDDSDPCFFGWPGPGARDVYFTFTLEERTAVRVRTESSIVALQTACGAPSSGPPDTLECYLSPYGDGWPAPWVVRDWDYDWERAYRWRVLGPGTYWLALEEGNPDWYAGWFDLEVEFTTSCDDLGCYDYAPDDCVDATCDPDALECTSHAHPDGTSCDDRDPCTSGDTCLAGVCVAGPSITCDDGSPITRDECIFGEGCRHLAPNDRCDAALELPSPIQASDLVTVELPPGQARHESLLKCPGGTWPSRWDYYYRFQTTARLAVRRIQTANVLLSAIGLVDQCPVPISGEYLACVANDWVLLEPGAHWLSVNAAPASTGSPASVTLEFASVCAAGEVACDDRNPCTLDTCDEASGTCLHQPKTDGAPCDDADPCFVNDACDGGVCRPGSPSPCEAVHGAPGACDPTYGCFPPGETCDEATWVPSHGTVLVAGDLVGRQPEWFGACSYGYPDAYYAFDLAGPAAVTATLTWRGTPYPWGQRVAIVPDCSPSAALSDAALPLCTDSSAVAVLPAGTYRAVVSGPSVEGRSYSLSLTFDEPCSHLRCPDPGPCSRSWCDNATASCVVEPVAGLCDDDNPCTDADACHDGVCRGEAKPDESPCPVGACVAGECQPREGALRLEGKGYALGAGELRIYHAGQWGTVCDDGFTDVAADVACRQMGFVGGSASASAGRSIDLGAPFWMDDVACTGSEARLDQCAFSGWGVSDCLPVEGVAVRCQGACRSETCTSSDPCVGATCTTDGHCALVGRDSPYPWAKSSWNVPCDDGDPCTIDDLCIEGHCGGVLDPVAACDDGDPCTVDTACKPFDGCLPVAWPSDAPCDDHDACTVDDRCSNYVCAGHALSVHPCDDGNACTADACDPIAGCSHAPSDGPCDDHDACSTADACFAGWCAGSPLPAGTCDDHDVCTLDHCDPAAGCLHLAAPVACDDRDPCTTTACVAGACTVIQRVEGCCLRDADCATPAEACVVSVRACEPVACRPCHLDADCGVPGNRCVDFPSGRRCAVGCAVDERSCGEDASCQEAAPGVLVCLPVAGDCECVPLDGATCLEGDLVLPDSCGGVVAVRQDCGDRGCVDEACCPPGTRADDEGTACEATPPERDDVEAAESPDDAPDLRGDAPDGASDPEVDVPDGKPDAPDDGSAAFAGGGGCTAVRSAGDATAGMLVVFGLLVLLAGPRASSREGRRRSIPVRGATRGAGRLLRRRRDA